MRSVMNALALIVIFVAATLMVIQTLVWWAGPPQWEEDCRKKQGIPSYAVDTRQPICMLPPFDMEGRQHGLQD